MIRCSTIYARRRTIFREDEYTARLFGNEKYNAFIIKHHKYVSEWRYFIHSDMAITIKQNRNDIV